MNYRNVLLFISPDIDDHRLQIAKQYGATHAVNVAGCNSKEVAQRVVEALNGDAPGISLECSGSDLSLVACIHVSILYRWLHIILIYSFLKLQTYSTFLKIANGHKYKLKGHWTSITSSTNFFPKKSWEFYIIKSVGMGNDCMLSFTF